MNHSTIFILFIQKQIIVFETFIIDKQITRQKESQLLLAREQRIKIE